MLDTSARQGILKPIRLVIVDPQPIVLQGLRSVLGTQPDFDVVASSSDRTSCLEAIRKLTPDVALLADKVPDLTVSEILAIVKAEKLSTRLVFFTESDTDHDLTSAIAAGACSAISKYASPATMLRSLRLMTKSGVALEKSDLSAPGKEADGDSKVEGMLELLTQRERQIARLVAEGMSNKEIARQLNVSDGTVKVHLYNIFQKLEITNRTVLATIALLQRPSGLAALSLAFLALAIADELKASEANDIFPDENGVGHVDEHAGYEPWKKGFSGTSSSGNPASRPRRPRETCSPRPPKSPTRRRQWKRYARPSNPGARKRGRTTLLLDRARPIFPCPYCKEQTTYRSELTRPRNINSRGFFPMRCRCMEGMATLLFSPVR
ncbi:LuxR C-terminal-related transcriptional regulator [Bradyrhizobium lupini]|uniref:LuxR C-terminal-related transcriptional regulator n=1 Tax=Rhizobium lupini TaxID=136996 RepID=UPI00366FA97B